MARHSIVWCENFTNFFSLAKQTKPATSGPSDMGMADDDDDDVTIGPPLPPGYQAR